MNYGLPENYHARTEPAYFDDVLADAHLWQADVYRGAAWLARKNHAPRIIDLGCGRGGKLLDYAQEFNIVGVDYGANIEYLRHNASKGEWYDIDLATEIIPPEFFWGSVVICADVVEHLVNPSPLIQSLYNATQTAAYVLLSTPDRERLYNGDTNHSPPDNPAHVREWTLDELREFLKREGMPVVWSGWTVSYQGQPDKLNTSLIILSNMTLLDFPMTFEECKS